MNPVLSIVLPVYNVAPYLDQCLRSLTAQDLSEIEIIAVDDGSTDECPDILSHYAEKCPAISVVRQDNGGLSSARNTGASRARGEYIAFVDSDDWITPSYYTNLLSLMRTNDLDVAHGNAMYHFEGRQKDYPIYSEKGAGKITTGRNLLKQRLEDGFFKHMVWMYVYKRSFIKGLKLQFVPGQIHEDILWTTKVLLSAQRIIYDPEPGYFYRQRIRPRAPDAMDIILVKVIHSYMDIAREISDLAKSVCDDIELQRLLRWQLVDDALTVFHKMRKLHSNALRREIYQKLRRDGFYLLLFRNATLFSQRRRIVRSWIKSYFSQAINYTKKAANT